MKVKTSKSLAKRMRVTRTGKLVRATMAAQHLVTRKSKRAATAARKLTPVFAGNKKLLKRFLPYL